MRTEMVQVSERATRHDAAVALIEKFGVYGAPPRCAVSFQNWNARRTRSTGLGRDCTDRLHSFVRIENGCSELLVGDRYLISEPFDLEVNDHGFVLWSAAEFYVSRRNQIFLPSPEFERRKQQSRSHLVPLDDESRTETIHLPYMRPEHHETRAIEAGAPIVGLVDPDQFPLDAHGWEREDRPPR